MPITIVFKSLKGYKMKSLLKIRQWQESTIIENQLNSASVTYQLTGAINGESNTHYSLCYTSQEHAFFNGIQIIKASININNHPYNNKSGTLIVKESGQYKKPHSKSELTIEQATGDLKGLTGFATLTSNENGEHIIIWSI